MEFCLANENDAMELSCLKKAIWETTYRGIYDDKDIDNYDFQLRKEKFKKLILDKNQEVYVCKDNDKIIGYMVLGVPLHDSLEGYEIAINDLGVDLNHRGQGIGKKFMSIAKEKNKKFFNCCNYYNENGKRFYEKMGGIVTKTCIDENSKKYSQIYYIY